MLLMAQVDIDRRFSGTIHRGFDSDGILVALGRINVNNNLSVLIACIYQAD